MRLPPHTYFLTISSCLTSLFETAYEATLAYEAALPYKAVTPFVAASPYEAASPQEMTQSNTLLLFKSTVMMDFQFIAVSCAFYCTSFRQTL